jgi:hypothetical protein
LERLRGSSRESKGFSKRLGLRFYRRVRFYIEYEAREKSTGR